MSKKFEDTLIETFDKLSVDKFKVNLESRHLFVCGGLVDIKAQLPPSFRDRFVSYSANKYPSINDAIVLAETFKDYFKENAYPNLLVFEEEIANLASLVIIFLESPGSLVELGMFCTKQNFYKKLVIVAPQDEVNGEDSFIYLGPLENIKKKEPTSVVIYPWPDIKANDYDECHLEDLCMSIDDKLSSLPKIVEFNKSNSGHIALLIAELVKINYPILIGEIKTALFAISLDIKTSEITRHIYLLNKLDIIDSIWYGHYLYYYPKGTTKFIFNFGKTKLGSSFDANKVRINMRQALVTSDDAQSRKRQSAMKLILKLPKGS